MEIITIFAERLLSFKYDANFGSEYSKKLSEWENQEFLFTKALENNIGIDCIDQFFYEVFYDRECLMNLIKDCCSRDSLYDVFQNLHLNSHQIQRYEESKMKFRVKEHKHRLSRLRLYALRVNNSCFLITGGAIKFTQEMQSHPDTLLELEKLKNGRLFLMKNDFNEEDIVENLYES
ncbi:hypothetical protein [Sphingobacterium sp. MYb382]|uniref:hypothetical protein n=1 Tax=Sphingobacterium sp. MYb382 TaxID=2745278 RepID=UPI0030ACF502